MKRTTSVSFFVIFLHFSVTRVIDGAVTGTVRIDGTPRIKYIAAISTDPTCGMLHRDPVPSDDWVISEAHGLANVVVHIERPENSKAVDSPSTSPALIDQANCMFRPHVIAALRGQPVKILNEDAFRHSSRIDLGGESPVRFVQQRDRNGFKLPVPGQAGIYSLHSDSHPWMNAWICYFDDPYFAVTDYDGKFRIEPSPPDGTYAVVAWHELGKEVRGELTVKDGAGSVDFTFKAPSEKPTTKPASNAATRPSTSIGPMEQ